MRISYDPSADALQILFREGVVAAEGIDLEDGVTADLDANGHVVGLEILDARARFGGDPLDSVMLERLVGKGPAAGRVVG
jgi:uncharacterized protein YuzE